MRARWALSRKLQRRSYCVQYDETDYAFVTRLCASEGVFFFFEHDPLATLEADGGPLEVVVIMIASTTELDRASGGVRLIRPSQFNMLDMRMSSGPMRHLKPYDIPTTMMEYMHAADANGEPYHMTKDIDAILCTDSNDEVMTVGGKVGPFIIWANLFNDHIDEPTKKLGGSVSKVVDRKRTQKLPYAESFGYVERDTSDAMPFPMGILNSFNPIPDPYWPLFYWRLRYKVILENGHLVLRERTRFLQGWRKAANR